MNIKLSCMGVIAALLISASALRWRKIKMENRCLRY